MTAVPDAAAQAAIRAAARELHLPTVRDQATRLAEVASVSYGYNPDSQVTSQATTGLAGASSNTYTYDEAVGSRRGTTAPPRPSTATTPTAT